MTTWSSKVNQQAWLPQLLIRVINHLILININSWISKSVILDKWSLVLVLNAKGKVLMEIVAELSRSLERIQTLTRFKSFQSNLEQQFLREMQLFKCSVNLNLFHHHCYWHQTWTSLLELKMDLQSLILISLQSSSLRINRLQKSIQKPKRFQH